MESLNQVTLAGKVTGLDSRNQDGNRAFRFQITTNQMYVDNGEKKLDPEVHNIKLLDPRTIAKYLKVGKNVVLTGRIKYIHDGSYILADKIHFPGSDDAS